MNDKPPASSNVYYDVTTHQWLVQLLDKDRSPIGKPNAFQLKINAKRMAQHYGIPTKIGTRKGA